MFRKLMLGVFLSAMVFLLPSAALAKDFPAQTSGATVDATETGGGANYVFVQSSVTISTGQTVTFKNTGTQAHTVTADDGSFDKTPFNVGDTFVTPAFTKPGIYTYKCSYHASLGMIGTIIVTGAATGPVASASPSPTAAASPSPTLSGAAAFGISPTPTPTAPPSQKYFPKIAGAIFVLALIGIVLGYVKTARKLADKS